MEININNLEDLLKFVSREDVSVKHAIRVFSECLVIVPVIFRDDNGEITVNKSQTIRIIEKYIQNGFIKKVVIFQSKP